MFDGSDKWTLDEYLTKFSPHFKDIPLDFDQASKELNEEAACIAQRYGIDAQNHSYPAWIWDNVFK